MIIHGIKLQNFFGFKKIEEGLPDTGLTVVTGENGNGKTTRYITSIAWILWGTTERGTPPYPADQRPNVTGRIEVSVRGKRLTVTRTWKGAKKDVTWELEGKAPVEYATTSKAQAALEEVIGTYATWARTHTFSSATAAAFTTADDSTRKRLLETMLGLDMFDAPLKEARTQFRDIGAAVSHKKMQLDHLKAQGKQTVAQARDVKALVGQASGDTAALAKLISQHRKDKEALERDYRDKSQAVANANAQLAQAQRELSKVGDGKCRTCGQALPHADVGKHKAAVERAQAEAEEAKATVAGELAAIRQEVGELSQAITDASVEAHQAEKVARAAKMLGEYKRQVDELKQKVEDIKLDIEAAETEHAVVGHAGRVLSTKGVRALLLGRALQSLSELANVYLSQLRPGVSIELVASTETKTGKIKEAISLNIEGIGGGWGYDATSGGERKRVDIAILLALSKLAGSSGTLVFDEALDAVDAPGVVSVCQLLETVSQTRPVVLITHNEGLAQGLASVKRQNIEKSP